MQPVTADNLVIFMPFAGKQHYIARPCQPNGQAFRLSGALRAGRAGRARPAAWGETGGAVAGRLGPVCPRSWGAAMSERVTLDFPDFDQLDKTTYLRGVCAFRAGAALSVPNS